MQRLEGQIAIVTGAGRGIGRAIALALAAEGAHVTLCARTRSELEAVAAEIEQMGGQALVVAADLTAAQQVKPDGGRDNRALWRYRHSSEQRRRDAQRALCP